MKNPSLIQKMRCPHPMTPKSESRTIQVQIKSIEPESLRDSLATEPFNATTNGHSLECSVTANSTVDLRARWNSMMRSLIGSEEALMSGVQPHMD